MNDVIVNKIGSIQRCIERAREEYNKAKSDFAQNYTVQDAAILNVVRACEQTIDLTNHIIKFYKMGIPASSAESFELLNKKAVIDLQLADKLKKMTHFRNTIIHQYQRINIKIVESVIQNSLADLIEFSDKIMEFVNSH